MSAPPPPQYPHSTKVAAHGLGATLIASLLAWKLGPIFGLSPFAPLLAGSVVVLTLLTSEPARRQAGSTRFGPANRVTLARAVLVGAVAAFIGSNGGPMQAIWVTGIASTALVMDGVDGWVARRSGLESTYGARLDMELDSLLMLVLSLLVWQWELAGHWVLFCGLARYGFGLVAWRVRWFSRELPESFLRKTCCVIGIGALTAAMWPWHWGSTLLAALATCALVLSFGIDTVWLVKRRTEDM
jgi:phosphatidylglycerophosphate synthase